MSKTAPNYKTNKTKSQLTAESIRQKLKLKHLEAANALKNAHPHVQKFLEEKGLGIDKLRQHSAKILGTGILASGILLHPPLSVDILPSSEELFKNFSISEKAKEKLYEGSAIAGAKEMLTSTFSSFLPQTVRPLYRNEEKFLENIVTNLTGVKVKATLEGEHLNTIYGRIGAEQHLRRYPGDTLTQHGDSEDQAEGMAPGLGAWGYFAPDSTSLTDDLVETEKWYAVVQTLYLSDWNTRQPYLKNWYKYRKVMIVNTENGNAVVAAIADSGPAAWTGKHYGGSPEVMDHLGGSRYKKGPVLVFFVDDPTNEVPLGPVDYESVSLDKLVSLEYE